MMEGVAERLTKLVDTDTIVGKPIFSVSGAQLIPIAKVTMGYLSGGGGKGLPYRSARRQPFGPSDREGRGVDLANFGEACKKLRGERSCRF